MTESRGTPNGEPTVSALYVDADENALAAVAAHVEREREDVTVATVADGVEALDHLGTDEFDCLIVGNSVSGVAREDLVQAADGPVVLYAETPEWSGSVDLVGVDALVEKGNGVRGHRLLVEKLVSAVRRREGRATARSSGAHSSETRAPEEPERVVGRASYFLVYADGTVVWSSEPFERVFPVDEAAGTVPDTPSLDERLAALLTDDPNAIRELRGEGGEAWFTVPTADGESHFRYARQELPSAVGPLDLVTIENVTDAVRRTDRLATLEPLVDRAQDGLCLLGENGVIDFCNASFAAMLGYDPEDLIGEHAEATLAAGELDRGRAIVDRLLTDPEADGGVIDVTFVDADGARIEVSVRVTLLTDDDGDYDGLVGVARDVTERRDRERTLEQYRAVVESAGDPMYALDADHRLAVCNDAMASLFDRPRSALAGTPLSDLFPETAVGRVCETVERVRDDDRSRGTCEIRLTDADGRERLFEASVGVLRSDGSLDGSVGTLHDVTERERRESDLDLLKQIFTRVLRHDVRTGLTVVRGQAEVLADRSSGDEREMAETIIDRSEDLVDTVEKVRTIGDVLESDTGRVTLDLRTAVERGITNVGAAYPDAEYRTDVSERSLVRAHPALPYAVENLVENAVAHNGSERPQVRVAVEEREDRALLRVADDGPGISQAEIDVLERREETPLKHGTGAGLWLVSWVVERSGGEIDFETDGTGTTVSMSLDRPGVDSRSDR